MALEEKGIAGIKRSEYTLPEEVLGTDIKFEEIPDGVLFYIKGKKVDLSTKKVEINLFQTADKGGTKLQKEHCEKFRTHPPDEEYIGLNYGPGEYVWIAKWVTFDGQHRGVQSETIIISEKWRRRYDAYQILQRDADAAGLRSSQAPAPAPAAPQSMGILEALALMEKGEDRAFNRMEQMARIMAGNKQETPTEVLTGAYKAAASVFTDAAKTNLEILQTVKKRNIKTMEEDAETGTGDGEGEDGEGEALAGPAVPAFLAPFMPSLKGWLDTLFQGGVVGQAAKTLIMSSEEFKAIANDPTKRSQAIACFEGAFGREKTEKAMKILLGSADPKESPKKGKGK